MTDVSVVLTVISISYDTWYELKGQKGATNTGSQTIRQDVNKCLFGRENESKRKPQLPAVNINHSLKINFLVLL